MNDKVVEPVLQVPRHRSGRVTVHVPPGGVVHHEHEVVGAVPIQRQPLLVLQFVDDALDDRQQIVVPHGARQPDAGLDELENPLYVHDIASLIKETISSLGASPSTPSTPCSSAKASSSSTVMASRSAAEPLSAGGSLVFLPPFFLRPSSPPYKTTREAECQYSNLSLVVSNTSPGIRIRLSQPS